MFVKSDVGIETVLSDYTEGITLSLNVNNTT